MKRRPPHFVLQFPPTEIVALAERYSYAQDDDALEAGKQIASGNYDRENLRTIVKWKSPRPAALIEENTENDIKVALQFASVPGTPESIALVVPTGLNGVGIPMASAILTAINPERYTVLDFRALESLGIKNWPDSFAFYAAYLKACRELAAKHDKSLRTLDRVLW